MVIDLILVLIIITCILSGYRKGLLMGLMSLLILVLCCLGATAARNALTPRTVTYLEPKLTEMLLPSVEEELDRYTDSMMDSAGEVGFSVGGQDMTVSDLMEFLKRFGLDVEEIIDQKSGEAMEPVALAVATAAARILAEKFAGALIFFAAFLVLYLALRSVALALNVVDRLPVVHTLNRLGGAVLGLAGSCLVMMVAAAVVKEMNLLPGTLGPLSALIVEASGKLLG